MSVNYYDIIIVGSGISGFSDQHNEYYKNLDRETRETIMFYYFVFHHFE